MSNASHSTTKQTPRQVDLASTCHCVLAQMPTLLNRRPGAQEGPSGLGCISLAVAVAAVVVRVGVGGGLLGLQEASSPSMDLAEINDDHAVLG